jgi:hypothetical protein
MGAVETDVAFLRSSFLLANESNGALAVYGHDVGNAAVAWIGTYATPCGLVFVYMAPVASSRTFRTTSTFVSPAAKTQ